MRQLITRVDDELHDRVKERARSEGLSVNAYVNRLLAQAVLADDRRGELERRIAAAGLTVHVMPSKVPPPRADVIARTRGAGTAGSEALDWTRGGR